MSFWFWVFPFLDFFFVRSSKIPSLLLVTFCWISSRKQLDDACRARRTTGGVVVGVFVLRFVCRANADGGDRHVFCSVVVCSFTRVLIFEREGKKKGVGWAPE